jgi:integrase/recombinase XerD
LTNIVVIVILDIQERLVMASKRKKRKLPKFLEKDQIEMYLKSFDTSTYRGKRNLLYTHLGLATGMRCSEMLDMKYSDLFEMQGSWMYYLKKSKNGSEAYIPIPDDIYESIMTFGEEHPDGCTGFVFRKRTSNEQLTTRALQKVCNNQGVKAELPLRMTTHMLRHTFAVHFLRETNNIALLCEVLRHSDISTTMIYVHMNNREIVEGVNRISLYKLST